MKCTSLLLFLIGLLFIENSSFSMEKSDNTPASSEIRANASPHGQLTNLVLYFENEKQQELLFDELNVISVLPILKLSKYQEEHFQAFDLFLDIHQGITKNQFTQKYNECILEMETFREDMKIIESSLFFAYKAAMEKHQIYI
jgi:hypothetical protein